MARALLVACGCRGRELGRRLATRGWQVRATSRREEGLARIEAAGLQAAAADPGRPGTVLDHVDDVTVLAWLLGSAAGGEEVASLHGGRLERLLERLVDTPVRGFVYEGTGTVDTAALSGGSELVRAAAERWRLPVAVLDQDPMAWQAWVAQAERAILELVGARLRRAGTALE